MFERKKSEKSQKEKKDTANKNEISENCDWSDEEQAEAENNDDLWTGEEELVDPSSPSLLQQLDSQLVKQKKKPNRDISYPVEDAKPQRIAFFSGFHNRLGVGSAIHSFSKNPLYDKNTTKIIFELMGEQTSLSIQKLKNDIKEDPNSRKHLIYAAACADIEMARFILTVPAWRTDLFSSGFSLSIGPLGILNRLCKAFPKENDIRSLVLNRHFLEVMREAYTNRSSGKIEYDGSKAKDCRFEFTSLQDGVRSLMLLDKDLLKILLVILPRAELLDNATPATLVKLIENKELLNIILQSKEPSRCLFIMGKTEQIQQLIVNTPECLDYLQDIGWYKKTATTQPLSR